MHKAVSANSTIKVLWSHDSDALHLTFCCPGASGQPAKKQVTDSGISFEWDGFEFASDFFGPVKGISAIWNVLGDISPPKCTVLIRKAGKHAPKWTRPFQERPPNVLVNWDRWEEDSDDEDSMPPKPPPKLPDPDHIEKMKAMATAITGKEAEPVPGEDRYIELPPLDEPDEPDTVADSDDAAAPEAAPEAAALEAAPETAALEAAPEAAAPKAAPGVLASEAAPEAAAPEAAPEAAATAEPAPDSALEAAPEAAPAVVHGEPRWMQEWRKLQKEQRMVTMAEMWNEASPSTREACARRLSQILRGGDAHSLELETAMKGGNVGSLKLDTSVYNNVRRPGKWVKAFATFEPDRQVNVMASLFGVLDLFEKQLVAATFA